MVRESIWNSSTGKYEPIRAKAESSLKAESVCKQPYRVGAVKTRGDVLTRGTLTTAWLMGAIAGFSGGAYGLGTCQGMGGSIEKAVYILAHAAACAAVFGLGGAGVTALCNLPSVLRHNFSTQDMESQGTRKAA